MNLGDFIRRTNSWHWLFAAVALSAAGSVFMPAYGWKDALAHRRTTLYPRIRNAKATLDGLRSLNETEALSAAKAALELRTKTRKLKRDFEAYGLEPIPAGGEAVFTAQSRVSEALAKRRIRIVSNEASVAMGDVAPMPSKGMQKAAAAPSGRAVAPRAQAQAMTAAEYRRQVDAQAAKMSDRAVREMFLADARRQIARMEAAERNAAKKPQSPSSASAGVAGAGRPPQKSPVTSSGSAAAPRPPKAPAAPAFRTSEIAYKTVGDFRDAFMFLVGETHGRYSHSLRDISVRRGEDGMDFSFTLRVQHR